MDAYSHAEWENFTTEHRTKVQRLGVLAKDSKEQARNASGGNSPEEIILPLNVGSQFGRDADNKKLNKGE